MKARTLKNIRRDAPASDRNLPELAPIVPSSGGKYTLEQLHAHCGVYAEAAVAHARWSAISVWLWRGAEGLNSVPEHVAHMAVFLCHDEDNLRLGFPNLGDTPPKEVPAYAPELLDEARLAAAEARKDWERAGSPYFTPIIARTLQSIHAYLLKQEERNAA
jgi:hypothetical protein